MDIVSSIKEGKLKDFGVPEKAFETVMADVFIFPEHVLKVYKKGRKVSGDFSNREVRFAFSQDDYWWNNLVSPEVYTGMLPLGYVNGQWEEVSFLEADEIVLVMNRVKKYRTLTKALMDGDARVEHIEGILKKIHSVHNDLVSKVPRGLVTRLSHDPQTVFTEAINDLVEWGNTTHDLAHPFFTRATQVLNGICASHDYFNTYTLSPVIDTNCDNLLILEEGVGCIDIMPPKEDWRVNDVRFATARVLVDVEVLAGHIDPKETQRLKKKYLKDVPQEVALAHELYSALIQWLYRHSLKQQRPAELYKAYVASRIE